MTDLQINRYLLLLKPTRRHIFNGLHKMCPFAQVIDVFGDSVSCNRLNMWAVNSNVLDVDANNIIKKQFKHKKEYDFWLFQNQIYLFELMDFVIITHNNHLII